MPPQLAELMVGREVFLETDTNPAEPGDVVLSTTTRRRQSRGQPRNEPLRSRNFRTRLVPIASGLAPFRGSGSYSVASERTFE
ncbi:hypothetical protein C8039_18855 [Halogeometricum sp. wsp3]|nr:hypothetical protein C8039_18855 [Halogeometricum sp. wsp3]